MSLANKTHVTITSPYALNLDEEKKDVHYEWLDTLLWKVSKTDKIILLDDFNAKVESNNLIWTIDFGSHGVVKSYANRHVFLLYALCSKHHQSINKKYHISTIE